MPIPGLIYPSGRVCGGRGGGGGEAIEQSRAIAHLGAAGIAGVDAKVQWEVATEDSSQAKGYADLAYYDDGSPESPVQVYELKGTWNPTFAVRDDQLDGYITEMRSVISSKDVVRGTELGSFGPDVFEINTGVPCGDPEDNLQYLDVYIGWESGPGLFDIYRYSPDCFDWRKERPPEPTGAPSDVPVPAEMPQPVDLPDSWWQRLANIPPATTTDTTTPDSPVPDIHGKDGAQIDWTCYLNPACFRAWAAEHLNSLGNGDNGSGRGGGSTDPHMVTVDGLHYEFQAAGEFDLASSSTYGLDVQARLTPAGANASVISSVAFTLASHTVEIGFGGEAATGSEYLDVDGHPYALADGDSLDFGGGAELSRQGDGYYVSWPGTGLRPALAFLRYDVEFYYPQGIGGLSGMLGDADGDPSNDLVTGYGVSLPADSDQSTLLGTFADSWRITQDESLFTYAPGDSTATFTDRSWPSSVLSIGDLTDAELAAGTQACGTAGALDGVHFDDCIIDYVQTADTSYVDAAAAQTSPVVVGGSQEVDSAGILDQNFDGSVPPNFTSPRYGVDTSLGTFAGPFGLNGRYGFSIPNLPAHTAATASLDLLAIGDWATHASTSIVTITVDGVTAWTGAVATGTPTATGTLSSGATYAVYPISVTVPHVRAELDVGVSADVSGATGQAFGVDNVAVSLDLQPPQTFDVSLPLSATTGSPTAGAGDLETVASEDDYRFTTSAPARLEVDATDCASTLGSIDWVLVDVSDGSVRYSDAGCGNALTAAMPAGSYAVEVTSPGQSGTYDLHVYAAPPPDTFAVALPVAVSNGVPSTGAGNLEVTASVDAYYFTTTVTGKIQIDLSHCAESLGYYVTWRLVDDAEGVTVGSGQGCGSSEIASQPPDSYHMEISQPGYAGTYQLGLSMAPSPDVFDVSLPATVSNGSPAIGAGNLETTASEDDYNFVTATVGAIQVDVSNCAASLGYYITWKLVDNSDGSTVRTVPGCASTQVTDLPASSYTLVAEQNGATGTYSLRIGVVPPPDSFDVSLPAVVSDGTPSAGAGNLETTSSEDDYKFTTTSTGGIQIDLSTCSASLGFYVGWKLIDEADGSTVRSVVGCGSTQVNDVAAGEYTLAVTQNGATGTYHLGVSSVPPPDVVDVSLPASVSNGVPIAGAGNLETTSSADEYSFTTTGSASGLQIDLSSCAASLGYDVNWKLVNDADGSTIRTVLGCGSTELSGITAGAYTLIVTQNGLTGTYVLGVGIVPPPDVFDVSLPVSVSNGVPDAGAGNLETTSSEDDYTFVTSGAGPIHVDVATCSATLGYYVKWALVANSDGSTVRTVYGCGSTDLTGLASGSYTLIVTQNGAAGTYDLDLSEG